MPTIYEEIADLMRSSVAGRDLPRDVIIRNAQKRWPNPEDARKVLAEFKAEAEAYFAAHPNVTVAYDPLELAIARQKQRNLK